MKKVEALINPVKLEEVKAALLMIAVTGLTMTELRVPDPAPGRATRYRGGQPFPGFVGQIKVEIDVQRIRTGERGEEAI